MSKKESLQSKGGIAGYPTIKVIGPDGKVKFEKTYKNLIVQAGRTAIADRLTNATPDSSLLVGYIAVGTGTTAPADGDTTLETETARKAINSKTHSADVAAIATTFNAGDIPVSTLKEVGLFIEGSATPDSGTLLARVAVNIAITALDALFVDWRITLSDA